VDAPHVALEQLEQYSRNKVPPEKLAFIEEHLLICEECRAALTALEDEARVIRHALVYYVKPQKE
jgi:predicted anti-sigma-YlaC factor YlaD